MPKSKTIMKWLLALFFIAAGVNHFVNPDFYVRIMPPYLPWHSELVFVSGVCEAVIGLAILISRLTTTAAWGAIALLVAVFPANVHMALNANQFEDLAPPVALWLRLPFQVVLIAWAAWFTKREMPRGAEADPR